MNKYFKIFFSVAIAFIIILNCGSEPTAPEQQSDPTPITVTVPGSQTSWIWYDTDLQMTWSGGDGDLVSINLYRGDALVQELVSPTANNGSYIWDGPVPSSWVPGSNFTIHIEDNEGIEGISLFFSVLECEGEEIVEVLSPVAGAEWQHYSTGYVVSWEYPSSKSTGSDIRVSTSREANSGLDADIVDIELWNSGSLVSILAEDVPTSETGSWTLSEQVPPEWGTGSSYRIKVIDDLDNFGWSETFSLVPCEGSEIITISEPNSSTVWEHSETDTHVSWDYPSRDQSLFAPSDNTRLESNNPMEPLSGDSVRIEIWQGGLKIDDYSSWIPNAGGYTRAEGIPGSWGVGTDYTLKIIDNYDNFGYSEQFEITNESLIVTEPTSSTEWGHYEIDTEVQWSYPSGGGSSEVMIELWRDGSYFADYTPGWVSNTGSYIRSEGIPPIWGTSSSFTYTIHVEDGYGSEAFSDEFTINESDVFTLTSPVSSSVWRHYVSGYEISWDNPSYLESDSIEILLYKGSQFVEEISPMILNTGSYTITDPISENLEPGNDYQVLITDEYADYGFSEEFTIEVTTGEEIVTITSPTSSTTWGHYEENTQVIWEYPRDTRLSYDSVKVDIYKGGVYLASYSDGWVDNALSYTRTDGIEASWGTGNDYQLRLEDDQGNFGLSEEFSIENADVINITNPVSSTQWMHYQEDITLEWSHLSDSVFIILLKNGVLVDSLSGGWIANTESYILPFSIPDTWDPGTDYQVYIEDNYGDFGWSEQFEVTLSSGADVIEVTEPGSGDAWEHFLTGYQIEWNYGQDTGNIISTGIRMIDMMTSRYLPLSGDEVLITLLKNGSPVDTLGGGWLTNSEAYTLTEGVSYYWGTGTDYQIHIEDDLGNYGTGEYFEIFSSGGSELITVTSPASGTIWGHYETNTEVTWEYPALDGVLFEDSVKLEIWSNGGSTFVGDYSDGWVENVGSYIRTDGIPAEWGIGTDYQIKVLDNLGNFGWSESFTIENAEAITITEPAGSTTWMHYSIDNSILWDTTGIAGDEVIIQLFKGSSFITTLVSGIPNDGSWMYNGPVPDSWPTATNYRVKITDTYGDWGWSDEFEIAVSSGQTIYQVTEPSSSTTWTHFDTDLPIAWSLMYDKDSDDSMIRRIASSLFNAPLSGDSVRIELWKGGVPVAALTNSTPNDYQWTYPGPLPSDLEAGTDYQIRVVDNLNNRGMSEQFTIDPSSGLEVITVTAPTSSTTWYVLEPNTQVIWEYPALAERSVVRLLPFAGELIARAEYTNGVLANDSVSIEIWKDGSYLADYGDGFVANTGIYTRTEAIPSSWSTGTTYQIKVIDSNSNYGYSEEFSISSGEIDITLPTSSTVWNIGENDVQVNWSGGSTPVKLELWANGEIVDTNFSVWITNTGSYTYPDSVPSSWDIGEHYQIHILNSDSTQHGWSEEFQIFNEIDVIYPDSQTTWAWSVDSLEIEWDDAFGDSICVYIFKGGTNLDVFLPWTDNDGNEIRIPAIPSSWGTGDDYQLKVVNNKGSYGFSDEFSIGAIEVSPVNTPWFWGMTDREIIWGDVPGSHVRLVVCLGEDSVGCFNDPDEWLPAESGSYIRIAEIPSSWDESDTYIIRIVDNQGNEGFSEDFGITDYPNEIIDIISVDSPREVCVIPSRENIYVSGSSVYVISTTNHEIVATISAGQEPRGLCSLPSGEYVYVNSYSSGNDSVYVIRTSDNQVISSIKTGYNAHGICSLPSGEYVYATGTEVFVIRTSDNTVVKEISVGSYPIAICALPSGDYVYVANGYSDNVSVIRTSTNTVVKTIQVGEHPYGICTLPSGDYVYVANWTSNNISVIRTSDNVVIETIDVDGCWGICTNPMGNRIYVADYDSPGEVIVIDSYSNTVLGSFDVGSRPVGVSTNSTGEYLYVTNNMSNNIMILN